jgi:hypothetical protein
MNKDKNIKYYCDICNQIPSSHSFEVVCHVPRIDNIKEIIFYTKVANAIRYDDTEGILNHYENLIKCCPNLNVGITGSSFYIKKKQST